jgi:hypothetical protein
MGRPTDEDIAHAEAALREAAAVAQLAGVDVARFHDYLEHDLPDLAHEALRQASQDREMPFGFFVHMSRAAELLGLRP